MRKFLIGSLCSLVLLGAGVVAAPPAGAVWSPPSLLRSIGGVGQPGVYAWGIQYNPVSNEMIVGDYLNFQIRRYDLNGNLLGSFYRSNPDGQPYSIGVDPRNGDILVPELADGGARAVVARYDKTGTFLSRISLSGMTSGNHYHVWLAVDSNGNIWVQDAHYWNNSSSPAKVREFSPTGSTSGCNPSPCRSWGTWGSTNGAMKIGYGIALDASNNVYVDDSTNKKIHVYTSTGTWLRDIGGPGDGVGQFTSDLRGVAIDKVHGWLYVNDSDAGEIEKFTLTGTPLAHWGSNGTGPGQFADGGRQLTVTPDGDVWDADYGNWRFQRFTSNGTLRGIYPDPAEPAAAGFLAQPRGVAVDNDTGKVYVADTWNERFAIFGADGSFQEMHGLRNSIAPYGFDYPRGIGFDQTLNRLWVTNTRAHNIRVYNADASYVDTYGSELTDSSGTGFFRWPVYADFFNGYAYIGDYNSGRVKQLNASTGAELGYKSMNNNGVAVDASTGNVYVVSWSDDRVTVLSPNLQTTVRTFGSRGSGDGQFQNPWGITVVNGVVYVTDTQLSRVQAFDLNGTFLGKWGGFGAGPYQLNNPSGITHDASGNLYVADAGNDRVQVYSTTIPKPSGDNRKPPVTITTPAAGATVPGGVVLINGTATDTAPFGVAKVEVSVQNTVTGLWWSGKTATWSATQTWNQAAAAGAQITNMTYSFAFIGATYNGSYHAEVKATDVSSITSATIPTVNFSTAGSPGDQLTPQTSVTVPANDAVVPAGPVTIQGKAGDNVGVAQVQIAIRDRTTDRWFNPISGVFENGPENWFATTVSSPGAIETNWSYTFTGSAVGSGAYYVTSRALDAVGNVETDSPFARFSIAGSGDTTAPETVISVPASGQSFTAGSIIAVSGTATDNVGVSVVAVSIQDTGSGLWWDGATWVSGQQWLNATVFSPGGTSTGWSYNLDPPAVGSYAVSARATDSSTNTDGSPAGRSFVVVPPDTTAPTTVLDVPTPNQQFPLAPIVMSGSATDDVGVTSVRLSIKNNALPAGSNWWNGTTWGPFAYVTATLASPGATSTTWTYTFNAQATGGYGLQAWSLDGANNAGAKTTWRNFSVA